MDRREALIVTMGGSFSPSRISNLAAWYDFSRLSTLYQDAAMTTPVAADNDPIGAVLDLSGNGYHITQGTAAQKWAWKTNIKNGLACAYAASQPRSMTRTNINLSYFVNVTPGANAVSVFGVIQQAGAAAKNGFLALKPLDASNQFNIWLTYDNVIYFDVGNSSSGGRISVAQPGGWDDNFHVAVFRRNNTAGLIQVDGVDLSTASFSDDIAEVTEDTWCVGQNSTNTFMGYLGEILVYKAALTDAELIQVRTYLNARWAVY